MKYNFTPKQNIVYTLSTLGNLFHGFFKPSKRKSGISVMIRVKNEEDWIGLALQSLSSFANEVVIIDNGSKDNTVAEIQKLKSKLPYPIMLKQNYSNDICEISNQALSLTSYRWVVRWDSDFIAYTDGERDIHKLRKYLLSLNQKNYYLIYPVLINFSYDLFHVRRNRELHSEGYIHTYHYSLKYIKEGKFEVLRVPFFYRVKRIYDIYFVHIGFAKSIEKLLYRYFWLSWIENNKFENFPRIIDFIRSKAKERWNVEKLEEIILKIFNEQQPYLRKYEIEKYGDYPKLLKPVLKNQPFKILYKNGEPYTRSDIPEFSEEKIDKSSELYQK